MKVLTAVLRCVCLQASVIFVLLGLISADDEQFQGINRNCTTTANKTTFTVNKENSKIFHNLESVIKHLQHDSQYKDHQQIVDLVAKCKEESKRMEKPTMKRKFPFIAIEGIQKYKKRVAGIKLAQSFKTVMEKGLPDFVQPIRNHIHDDAIYYIGLYLRSYNISRLLEKNLVVINGYWMQFASQSILRCYQVLPPRESEIYSFPEDLLRPDLVFFLSEFKETSDINKNEYAKSRIESYLRMRNPSVYAINSTYITIRDINLMRQVIKKELSSKYPFLEEAVKYI